MGRVVRKSHEKISPFSIKYYQGFLHRLRSKRFRLVSEQRKKLGYGIFGFALLAGREIKREPKNETTPLRSFTRAIFREVFDSRSPMQFLAPRCGPRSLLRNRTETLAKRATFYTNLPVLDVQGGGGRRGCWGAEGGQKKRESRQRQQRQI